MTILVLKPVVTWGTTILGNLHMTDISHLKGTDVNHPFWSTQLGPAQQNAHNLSINVYKMDTNSPVDLRLASSKLFSTQLYDNYVNDVKDFGRFWKTHGKPMENPHLPMLGAGSSASCSIHCRDLP